MFRGLFGNLQPVVKNLLIINLLFFLATFVLQNKDIFLISELGLYYPDSTRFRPFQIMTHFFMHDGMRHILFNMLALVVFGNMLERIWGAKRFLIFFFITAFGAALVHNLVFGYEVYSAVGTAFPNANLGTELTYFPVVGASGAIYGLIVGAAMYFPNTVLYLYAVIPLKVKWLALAAVAFDVVSLIQARPDDNTAHFAHLGGAIFGFIMIMIWRKSRTKFY